MPQCSRLSTSSQFLLASCATCFSIALGVPGEHLLVRAAIAETQTEAHPADPVEPVKSFDNPVNLEQVGLPWILLALFTAAGGIAYAVKSHGSNAGLDRSISENAFEENDLSDALLHEKDEDRSPESINKTTRLIKADLVVALIADLHSLDADKRRQGIWELGQRGDSRAIQPLVDLLMDSDSMQRSLILAAVSEIAVRSLKPMNRALMLSLQDESPDVRKNAIRDATRIYDALAHLSQLLQYAASDTNDDVRDTAHWALSQMSRIRLLPESEALSGLPQIRSSAAKPSGEKVLGDQLSEENNSQF
jgi:hypothetical protein